MKKLNFKVGDWVTSKSWCDSDRDPEQITKIEFATSPDEEDFVFFGDNYCIQLEYIEPWSPKQYEYCWSSFYGLVQIVNVLDYKFEVRCFYGIKNLYDNPTVKLEELEPFIGELPKRVKDFKELK